MPVYEYYCQACGHEWEREQRISDEPVKACPKCKARKAKRLISRTSFVLKGGGWYSDLYSSGGKKGDDAAAGEGAGGDKGKDTDKGDKKDGKRGGKKDGDGKKDGGGKKSDPGSKAAA